MVSNYQTVPNLKLFGIEEMWQLNATHDSELDHLAKMQVTSKI
jgi:hypothetical protein